MKTDSEHKQRLLDEVLVEDAPSDWQGENKRRAVAAFRRGRTVSRVAFVARLAAIIIALGVAVVGLKVYFANETSGNRHANETTASLAPDRAPKPLPTLTDEELIARFPPNTCTLAEVDGRKVLLFADIQLQKKFMP